MITIVALNPCIDWQYTVPTYTHGEMNRVRRTYQGAASKGMNAAIVLKNLGENPLCLGFNFTEGGEKITQKLNILSIPHNFENIEGAVRINIKLYEASTGIMTELNQPGEFVPSQYINALTEKLKTSTPTDILVLSGSLPPGISTNIYAEFCSLWKGKVFLDAEGEALRTALIAKKPPFAIKPNLSELERTFDVKLSTPQEIAAFCHRKIFSNNSPSLICVSMGTKGAVLVTPAAAYYCPALKVAAKGVQGAGDSMVAGLIHGVLNNLPPQELLRYAIAAASASVILEGTELCQLADFNKMLGKLPKNLDSVFPLD